NLKAVTSFKLNPYENQKYYPWRAGSKSPLLVWDPEGTGLISSGTQLFGNWFFGGKKSSYTPASINGSAPPAPWKDGYEALGTLDADGNGRISGIELDGLSLWYDRNMNGISEAGEVKSIKSAGIISL